MTIKTLLGKNFKLHLPWLIWFGVILLLSLTPGDQLPDIRLEWLKADSIVHILMYGLLSFLMLIGFFHQKNELLGTQALYISVTAVLVGLIIEVLQETVAYQRYFSWADILANTLGVILGYILYVLYKKKELNLVRFLK